MSRELHKLLGPMSRRLRLQASRGVIGTLSDAGKLQTAQVALLAGEVRDGVERFQNYGFTSVPLGGAEAVFLSLNGSRDQGVLVVVDDRRYRKRAMQAGESAMHNHLGDYIHIKADGSIEVLASSKVKATAPIVEVIASAKMRFDTPLMEVTGEIKDKCDSGGSTMSAMRTAHNTHKHVENNVTGGKTNTPDVTM